MVNLMGGSPQGSYIALCDLVNDANGHSQIYHIQDELRVSAYTKQEGL